MSVVFDFNASLIDVAPMSPILFPVDLTKSVLLMNIICVLFLLCLQLRLSFASVVFDFNASLNDVASVFLMPLTVDIIQHKNMKHSLV